MYEDRNTIGTRAAKIGIFGNIFLTIFNIGVGIISGSYALIAEGAHTSSDIATSIISYIGFKIGEKPADEEHPLGHGRAESIAGLIIVIFLAIVAYEIITGAIIRLIDPNSIAIPNILAAIMAVIGIIANILMSQYIIILGRKINSPAIIADGQHQRVDLYSSLAILIGVLIAQLGYPSLDPIIGLIIGGLVLKTAYTVGKENINNIMGKIPSEELIEEIKNVANSVQGVYGIHDIRVNYLGSYATVTFHLELEGELSLKESHKIAHIVQDEIIEKIDIIHGATAHACPYGLKYDHSQELDKK